MHVPAKTPGFLKLLLSIKKVHIAIAIVIRDELANMHCITLRDIQLEEPISGPFIE